MYKCVECGYEISNERYFKIFMKEGSVEHNCLNGNFHNKMVVMI